MILVFSTINDVSIENILAKIFVQNICYGKFFSMI